MPEDLPLPAPDFSHERAGPWPVCGIDEVGRGPWAGPVMAAAVILDPGGIPRGIHDCEAPDRRRAAPSCRRPGSRGLRRRRHRPGQRRRDRRR